jgi:hypothetical protein
VTKPADNEFEISIFGPGVGECIVVHLGAGRWMVVDSCLNPATKQPVALEYLRSLGINVESDVVAVVVTHWHDDHTRGASLVLETCKSAEFWCSGAFNKREFFEVVASASQITLEAHTGSGVDEISRIFEVLRSRRSSGGRTVSPEYAKANAVLFRRSAGADVPACCVEALSPSSTTVTRGLISFAPRARELKRSLPNPGPNELSVALHVQFGSIAALLGADLEVGSSDDIGWRAVVRNPRLPSQKAAIVKVPHHGSRGADHEPVWGSMITTKPNVGVTPFHSSGLPTEEDIARLRQRADLVFHASPRTPRRVQLDRTAERTLEGVRIRERMGELGQIRFRVVPGGDVTWTLAGAARTV